MRNPKNNTNGLKRQFPRNNWNKVKRLARRNTVKDNPCAFAELILQRRELGLQREELRKARETREEQAEIAHRQAEVTEREAEVARLQAMPKIEIQEGGRSTGLGGHMRQFQVLNFGGTASDIEVTLSDAKSQKGQKWRSNLLERKQSLDIHTPEIIYFSSGGYLFYCEVSFLSERQDRYYQVWEIEFSDCESATSFHWESPPKLIKTGEEPPSIFEKP